MAVSHFIQSFAQPLATWSVVHRLCVALSVASFTFVIGMHLWAAVKMANIAVRRSVIEKLAARVQAASATVAALPAVRQRVTALQLETEGNALVDDTNLLQTLTTMVATSNLRLDKFEPGKPTTELYWRERRLQLLVIGAFTDLVDFTAQLAALPYLVVPIAAQLKLSAQKRAGDALSLHMSLRVIDINISHPVNAQMGHLLPNLLHEHDRGKRHDPFEAQNTMLTQVQIAALTPTALQLVGVLQRGPVRAALIQSPSGFSLLHVGDVLDGRTVTRIDPASLSLSSSGQTHTLLLQEAKP